MADSKKDTGSGIFILVLMIVFISFFQGEKDKHKEATPLDFSSANNSSLQAIVVPEISSPGTDILRINKLNKKYTCSDYDSDRKLVLDELISSGYNSYQLKCHSKKPVIGLIFRQKVPEQGTEDDILSIS
jgi:hypothetical protein